MTSPNLSLRFPAPFPSTVVGSGGIAVKKENGVWIIAPDFLQLATILPAAFTDPTTKQVWVYDPVGDTYNVMTLSGLGEALNKGASTASVAIGTGSKVFVTQAGKAFDVGAFV